MATRNPLAGLFGRSPIGSIQEHMQLASQAETVGDRLQILMAK